MTSLVRENIFKKENIFITNYARKRLYERVTEDEYKHFRIVRDAFINGKQIKTLDKCKLRYLHDGFMFVFSWNRLLSVYKL